MGELDIDDDNGTSNDLVNKVCDVLIGIDVTSVLDMTGIINDARVAISTVTRG